MDTKLPCLEHSRDALKNLSYFVAKCWNCDREHRETTIQERAVGFIMCSCGSLVAAKNRIKWS